MDTLEVVADLEQRAQSAGLTVGELCRRAKIAPITFRRWRNKEASPNLSTLDKLQAVLAEAEMREAS